jgi:hypothetical protein
MLAVKSFAKTSSIAERDNARVKGELLNTKMQNELLGIVSQNIKNFDVLLRSQGASSQSIGLRHMNHLGEYDKVKPVALLDDDTKTVASQSTDFTEGLPDWLNTVGTVLNAITNFSLDMITGNFEKYCPYLLLIGFVFMSCCVSIFASVGYVTEVHNRYTDEEDDWNIPWYEYCCVVSSQCCCGLLLQDYRMAVALIVWMVVMQMTWYVLCKQKVVYQYFAMASMVVFACVLVVGTVVMVVFFFRQKLYQSSVYKHFRHLREDVASVRNFNEWLYGDKFYEVMKKSGEFTKKQLKSAKLKMEANGHFVEEALEDVVMCRPCRGDLAYRINRDDEYDDFDQLEQELRERLQKGKITQAQYDMQLRDVRRRDKERKERFRSDPDAVTRPPERPRTAHDRLLMNAREPYNERRGCWY